MISLLPPTASAFGLQPGTRYLFDNAHAADYLKNGADCEPETYAPAIQLSPAAQFCLFFSGDNAQPQRILIIRAGGLGDLIFLTPSLRALVKRFQQHEFTVCGVAAYRPAISHPDLDAVQWLDYPPKMDDVNTFDLVVPLEELVERDEDHTTVDIFAQALGLELTGEDRIPAIRANTGALAAALEKFPQFPGMRRYGIALRANHAPRTWPFNYIQQLASILLDRDPHSVVFLFGQKKDWPDIENVGHERLIWLPEYDLSLTESLAVLATMDGFVGPDSGLAHAAGALGIPTVTLFGPYRWQQRVDVFPSVYGVNGFAPCAPCHFKGRNPLHAFPPGKPCEQHGCCVALGQIQPDRVYTLLRRLMQSHQPSTLNDQPLHAMSSFFGPILKQGDVHPELEKAALFHLGDFGAGAATIEEAKFLHALVLCLKPLNCLETGTETGWTACHIAKALEENGRGHLITLETDPRRAEEARQHLDTYGLTHRVNVLEVPSQDYLTHGSADTPVRPIEFALLDTHIELRAEELRLLTPHLAPGALVCVHDTSPAHPCRNGVELLNDLRATTGFTVVHLPTPRGLTLLEWRGNVADEATASDKIS